MKNTIRIISLLLTAMLLLGSMTVLSTISVFAAGESDTSSKEESTTGSTPTDKEDMNTEQKVEYYKTTIYANPEDKLATMGEPRLEKGDYQLYVDDFSGEIALKNTVTNEILFSNPYDIGASKANESENQTKEKLLSQLIINFTSNGNVKEFYSFREAAARDQIKVKNIKNGIRVEYTIGREQSKVLLPRVIEASKFEALVADMQAHTSADPAVRKEELFKIDKLLSYYLPYDPNTDMPEAKRQEMYKKYPVTKNKGMAIYVFDSSATDNELTRCEDILKTYAPDYTYEMLDEHHAETEYVADDLNPPLFKMALEYTLDDNGLSVRLPANGIRFNESLYQLNYIEILPFMGAGNNAYEGYNVFPDGSGATFDYQDLNIDVPKTVSSKVYGKDYAYHSVTGQYQKSVAYPVFGAVEETTYYKYMVPDTETGEEYPVIVNGGIVEKYNSETYKSNEINARVDALELQDGKKLGDIIKTGSSYVPEITVDKRGFMAIIEDGEALTELSTNHPGTTSEYNSLNIKVTPRPSDTYKISGSLSVSDASSEYTVVCERKYVGNYKIRYMLLSDHNDNLEEGEEEYKCYDTSWFGMAVAYRDYLMSENILTPLTEDKLTDDIPLYIETFGALTTLQKVLSVPVNVMTALTTFEDIETMYSDLSEGGVKNVNFKLTGYANGGLEETVPYKFNIEKAVGGKEGFQKLLDYAADINTDENSNMGIFPNFDFAYVKYHDLFDGISNSKHVAKTIDDRYASRKEYSPTQGTISYYDLAISPAYYSRFYEKIKETYLEEFSNVYGISVGTLGTALNSDFDEDEPYNREDSKDYTEKAFAHFDANYNQVMTDGGNAYSWKYVDHILGVALDSSRYNISADSIPFIGVVLHGSVQFAGTAMNMEGNMEYAMLKAIENGASPYFILSYRNTQSLKENQIFSQYYSVRYDIWEDDLIENYAKLNSALSDVQDKFIIGHEKLEGGLRVPDLDELRSDLLADLKDYAYNKENADQIALDNSKFEVSIARDMCKQLLEEALDTFETVFTIYDKVILGNNSGSGIIKLDDVTRYYNNYKTAYDKLQSLKEYAKYENSTDPEEKALYTQYTTALKDANSKLNRYLINQASTFRNQTVLTVDGVEIHTKDINTLVDKMNEKLELAVEYIEVIAAFEGATIEYADGAEDTVLGIINVDALPRFTKAAVKQAQEAVRSMTSDRFIETSTAITLSGAEMQKFPKYNDEGKIEDVNVKETYYAVDMGNDNIAYTGTNASNYKFYKIVRESDYEGQLKDEKGNTVAPISFEIKKVYIIPITEEVYTGEGADTIYRNFNKNAEWYYYKKDAEGKPIYLVKDGASYYEMTFVEYTGEAVNSNNDTVYSITANGETLKDSAGNILYVSGTYPVDYKVYTLAQSTEDMRKAYNDALQKVMDDTAALGQITADEFYTIISRNDIPEEEEIEEEEAFNKYETAGIIAVTYGSLDGEAYKTMILNYNNYAVTIEYNGVLYTISAYGFVTVKM